MEEGLKVKDSLTSRHWVDIKEDPTQHQRLEGEASMKPFPQFYIPRCIPCVQFCLERPQELQTVLEWQRFPLLSFLDRKEKVEGFRLVSSFAYIHAHTQAEKM